MEKDFLNTFFKNKGAVLGLFFILVFILIALFAPLISPYDPTIIFENQARLSPSWTSNSSKNFLLGTDDVGRDTLSRLIFGSRISMIIGFFVTTTSLLIGTLLGLLAGYFQGKVDSLIMRIIDIIMTFPSILLAIVVVSILGPNLMNSIIAVSIVSIPSFTRIVRASTLLEKKKQYVMASKTFGASDFRILFLEVLPNCLAPIIVQGSLIFSEGILSAAALGFLGLGAQPPTPEWGTMLSDSRAFIESSPWLVTLPGVCILLTVLGFNLFGDGLRDALDPKLKKTI